MPRPLPTALALLAADAGRGPRRVNVERHLPKVLRGCRMGDTLVRALAWQD
jgi:hypothetical protein